MTGRFSRLPAAAVVDRRASAEAVRVLGLLGCYADKDGYCWPAVTTLARRLGLHRTTVQRHLRKLEALGYVDRAETMRASRGGWGRNRYRLSYPDFATSSAADSPEELGPEQDKGKEPKPASEPQSSIECDAAPRAASVAKGNGTTLANSPALVHQPSGDAAPVASSDAASHAAQNIPMIHLIEKEPSASAGINSQRNKIPELEDRSSGPAPDALKSTLTTSVQHKKSSVQALPLNWGRPQRPPNPRDYVTQMANRLVAVPGYDREKAWCAIMALPAALHADLEANRLRLPDLLHELERLGKAMA
jgi:DNA-binding transcriptional ArsR family regulator